MSAGTTIAWGIYVHIPWCRIRCPYCAFYVERDGHDVPWEAFVARVLAEHHDRRSAFPQPPPTTIYLGGGTPSRMPVSALQTLLDGLETTHASEVTVEANPEDVTPAWLDGVLRAGVDRVSLGIQTLSATAAKHLSRTPSQRAAVHAARLLRSSAIRTWSADLMFGLHQQTLAELKQELSALVALQPPHVSVYGLTIEPGTGYARAEATGRIRPANEEIWREMYTEIVEHLGRHGIPRYEVSNFARPGHEALHNRGYWLDIPYMGLGPSAHGYTPDGTRWHNVPDVQRYLAADDPTEHQERPEGASRAADMLVAGMRGVTGIHLATLRARSGWQPSQRIIAELQGHELVDVSDGRMFLSPEGFYVADAVVARLIDHLEPR